VDVHQILNLGGTKPKDGKQDRRLPTRQMPRKIHASLDMDILLLPNLKCEDTVRFTSQYSEL